MLKAYKYRLYPNVTQKIKLAQHFGCCRWLYNYALNKKKTAYETDKTKLSRFDLQAELPALKKQEETKWLADVHSQSLQYSLKYLDGAYQSFFKKNGGYPKFKKKNSKQSYSLPQEIKIDFENEKIYIPKIGWTKMVLSRKFDGKIKTVTFTKTTTGKYFASVLVETTDFLPKKKSPKKAIGIDLGLTHFLTDDSGNKLENPKFLKSNLDRLKVLQRRASKKKLGSNNRKKANQKVAKLYEKISNQRLDFLHKTTYRLTHKNHVDTICMEDLSVKDLMQNHNLAQGISDVSWAKFTELLKYKCEWYGKNFIQIPKFYPSSKTCNNCGTKNENLQLQHRNWKCEICGETHDRDINAAKNIKFVGLSGVPRPVEPGELRTKVRVKKQEFPVLLGISAKNNSIKNNIMC